MTGRLENLSEKKVIQDWYCPGGKIVFAKKECIIQLDEGFEPQNVLCVPKFKCNLMYVSQLTDEAQCLTMFTDKLHFAQVLFWRMMIRVCE